MTENDKDDITDTLTPEQALGTLIIQASHGEYTTWVSRRAWRTYGSRVNFEAMEGLFDKYLDARKVVKS